MKDLVGIIQKMKHQTCAEWKYGDACQESWRKQSSMLTRAMDCGGKEGLLSRWGSTLFSPQFGAESPWQDSVSWPQRQHVELSDDFATGIKISPAFETDMILTFWTRPGPWHTVLSPTTDAWRKTSLLRLLKWRGREADCKLRVIWNGEIEC